MNINNIYGDIENNSNTNTIQMLIQLLQTSQPQLLLLLLQLLSQQAPLNQVFPLFANITTNNNVIIITEYDIKKAKEKAISDLIGKRISVGYYKNIMTALRKFENVLKTKYGKVGVYYITLSDFDNILRELTKKRRK